MTRLPGTPVRHVAAAPSWVRALLAGPDRAGRVVHRGVDAVYTEAGGVCVGVLSTAAAAVPCGLRSTLPALPPQLRAARTVRWGGGRLALDGVDVVVTRTRDVRVPRLEGAIVARASRRLGTAVSRVGIAGALERVAGELPAPALDALAHGSATAVGALVGRGSGLTPVGDDVLAGWLATTVAASPDGTAQGGGDGVTDAVAAAVATRGHATTTLSATLLSCAARGEVLPEFRSLLLDLAAERDPSRSLDALLRIGHTSGAGLVLGALLALRHLGRDATGDGRQRSRLSLALATSSPGSLR